ncbi:uncharacterized protein LOC128257420 [Drosophila gunungcola]|uniref:Uncharacterized protein n=1 Tax=Drosophila gunungcola TaxID=103775 RepID=A0A9Q0BRK0_9MUSC|nr:uncharacterized protein LOC128257420 [Drosophila gunungcola]KAI8041285.1 hypothetical protein M5D96_005541 [Drosophila gunungcola]
MSSNNCGIVLLIACCLMALVTAYPQPNPEESQLVEQEEFHEEIPLVRRVRSPEGGSVVITASKDNQVGREASIQYNHNLFSSRDGRGSIDAYAQASRNFDFNRNDYGGGIQGTWRF